MKSKFDKMKSKFDSLPIRVQASTITLAIIGLIFVAGAVILFYPWMFFVLPSVVLIVVIYQTVLLSLEYRRRKKDG
jgi:CHASE2 domain-containing sensor protein